MDFNKSIIRFLSVSINNINNVENGTIHVNDFSKKDSWTKYSPDHSDVIGLYGQNGSGKSTVVEALALLKMCVLGNKFLITKKDFDKYVQEDLITIGKDSLTVKAHFLITDNAESKIIEYAFTFGYKPNTDPTLRVKNNVILENESFSILNTDLSATDLYVKYSAAGKQIVEPVDLYKKVISTDDQLAVTFQLCKVLSQKECSTYLFNSELINIKGLSDVSELFDYMKTFRKYINSNFCIITKDFTDLTSAKNLIPLAVQNEKFEPNAFIRFVGISLSGSQFIEQSRKPVFTALIEELNTVINSIIPDMQLKMVTLSTELSSNNQIGDVVEVVSVRNGNEIPLRYESDGIKKLLCILNLLVLMHNNQNMFVVIDELDASIFEYLLGEILTMLTESGKGQLFFTSHNLYPLELLDKESIFFTTTNSQNRYIKFKYIKPNHNLRDQYLKTIRLGGQDEPVYQESDTANMRLSFYSAGRKFENFLKTIQEKN